MRIGTALVAHGQAPEQVQPGEGAFDYPAVPSQLLTTFDAAPRDTGPDPAGARHSRRQRRWS